MYAGMLPLILTILTRDYSRGYYDPYEGLLEKALNIPSLMWWDCTRSYGSVNLEARALQRPRRSLQLAAAAAEEGLQPRLSSGF